MASSVAAQTPQRVTRARSKTPLPALAANQSNAYGAPGKANLNQQLRGQSAASFSQQFETTRVATAAVPASPFAAERAPSVETDHAGSEAAASRAPVPRRRQYSRRPAVIEEEPVAETRVRRALQPPPDEPSVLGRNATDLDYSARYSGIFAAAREEIRRQLADGSSRFWVYFLLTVVFTLGFISCLVSLFAPLPAAIEPYRDHLSLGIRHALHSDRTTQHLDLAQVKADILQSYEAEYGIVHQHVERTVDKLLRDRRAFDMTEEQLTTVFRFNHIINNFQSMHTVNWFSVGLGARIDPYLTSATKTRGYKNFLGVLYDSINPLYIAPNPPIAALTKWDEATECWCGAPNDQGYVQIAIMTPKEFYPDHLTIEHVPRAATLRPQAAPKDFEVWVDLGTEEEVKRLHDLYQYDYHFTEAGACGAAPGTNWFCVYKGSYDIQANNHIQMSQLWPAAASNNMATSKVIVRATSNHGADHTCFYRLRMSGQQIDADEETKRDYEFAQKVAGGVRH